jgi:uncharacterized protein
MTPEWRSTLLQCMAPFVALVAAFAVRRFRHLSWQADVGVRWPRLGSTLGWVGGFIALIVVTELASRALGLADVESWHGKYDTGIMIVRGLVIVLVAPLAEELMFLGLLYSVLSKTRLGPAGAVAVVAVAFAILHFQYAGLLMLFVLLDAVYYGAARVATGSVLVPIVCHMIGNAYAVYQRVH